MRRIATSQTHPGITSLASLFACGGKRGRKTQLNGVIARYEAISMLYRENMHGRSAYVGIASYLAMTRGNKEKTHHQTH
ncbi:hypothetical protein HDF22_002809 [Mucilaginibacter lappiensis]|uniref:Uncharacterized protein n=1 Tax=Mucilaginibacter lappiensis TaxID=354630 RepID=A0A841JGG1_9SPHI|nr:hypothetical protein [Mucilaginibacter lappiensis]